MTTRTGDPTRTYEEKRSSDSNESNFGTGQGKQNAKEPHLCLKTRVAKVTRPLVSVTGMVDQSHTVIFDSEGSYALNKRTGRKVPFSRHAGGWNLEVELESPEKANEVTHQMLADMQKKPPEEAYGVAIYKDGGDYDDNECGVCGCDELKTWTAPGPFGRPGGRP